MSSNKQFRMTHQRRIILQELRKTETHPSADEIFLKVRQVLPHISLGTVYRNLETLHKKGLIKKLELGGYQKRFDGNPDNHYHISCRICNSIDDIPANAVKKLEFFTEGIEGYTILGYTLHFIGICKQCSSNEDIRQKPDIKKLLNKYFY